MRGHPLHLFLCVVLAGCAGQRPPPRPPEASVARVEPAVTSWGPLLFPPRAPAPEPTPALPSAPEPPPVFAPSAYDARDYDASVAFADVAAFCAVATRDADIPRSHDTPNPGAPRPARAVRCQRIPVGASFAGNAEIRGVRAVRIVGSDFAYSTLLVQTDRGLVPLEVGWDAEDPNDPGCPGIFRATGIERVGIENGLLVVVALGVVGTWVDVPENSAGDTGARQQLVREVTVVKRVGDGLHARTFPPGSGPPLGWKLQPHAARWLPWDRLVWREWHDFRVRADGTLAVRGMP